MENYTEELLFSKFTKIKSIIDLLEFEEEVENTLFNKDNSLYGIIKQAINTKRKSMDKSFYKNNS